MANLEKGFSLIELMVVVALVGLLSAVAVPVYRDYMIRAKIHGVVGEAHSVLNKLREGYDLNGAWPSTVTVGGTQVTKGSGYNVVNSPSGIYGFNFTDADSPSNDAVLVHLYLTGLADFNIPGYTDPVSTGSSQGNNVLMFAVRANSNGTFETICGEHHQSNSISLDRQYFPSVCDCLYVYVWWNTAGDCYTGS